MIIVVAQQRGMSDVPRRHILGPGSSMSTTSSSTRNTPPLPWKKDKVEQDNEVEADELHDELYDSE